MSLLVGLDHQAYSGLGAALHVEMDSGFVPDYYQAKEGQEVAVFGRWIIDCGHTDFASEIHPPLMLAKSSGDNSPDGITHATIISRPFLVQQTFGGKPLRSLIVDQLAKIYSLPFDLLTQAIIAATYQMSARPDIAPSPFNGTALMNFVLRPQFARLTPNAQLMVRTNLYARPGVAVEVVNNGDDSIGIWVLISDVGYQSPQLPAPHNVHHPLSDIKSALPDIASTINGIQAAGPFTLNALGDAILDKGFDTNAYTFPAFSEAPLGNFSAVTTLPQSAVVTTSTVSIAPIIGTIELKWNK